MKLTTAVAALALMLALGCSNKGGGAPFRVPVTVARAEQRPVPYELVGTGTVEPRQTASVQAQVTGILTRVAFREGEDVAAGQLLFQIDPRPFQSMLEQAQAMLARDQAQAQNSLADAARYAELVKQDYVTKSDYEAKRAAAEALQATVRSDSAAVANAQLNLEWAAIRAPIAGRTGRLLVREGNMVRANPADPRALRRAAEAPRRHSALPPAPAAGVREPVAGRHTVQRRPADVRGQQRRHEHGYGAAQGRIRQPGRRPVAGRVPERATAAVQ